MQAEIADKEGAQVGRWPGTVVARLTARGAARSGVIWGSIFAIAIASSAISYSGIYKTLAQRDALAVAYGSNHATSALLGPASQLQTVAGFTVFKVSMALMILGAVWGLLTSTRLLRGEEENGRWDLLLAGQTTRRRATAQALGGLAAGVFTLWAVASLVTVLTGLDSKVKIAAGPALYFSTAMVATAVMFLAVGALTSQLGATRRQAAAYAAAFLGVSYAVRMIADAGVGMHWLIWASPLGWVEELRPLTVPQPIALLPIIAFTMVVAAGAIHLSGTRDIGASIVPDRPATQPHLRLLSGPTGLAIRMMRPTVIGWWVAIVLSSFLYGFIARSAGATISRSSVEGLLSKLGAPGTGADAILGVCFLVLAALVAFVAANQVTAARSEESGGRLDHLLVGPLSRASWLWGRIRVAVVVVLVDGLTAGVFAWLGAASQHSQVSFTTLLAAGLNIVPPAISILGVGVLALGVWPRAAAIVVYTLLGWSLFGVLIGGIGVTSHWVLDTSVFHDMASAPAVPPNWEASGAMVAVGSLAALLGGFAFRRRDLQGE